MSEMYTCKSLGLDLAVPVPSTVEEYETLAKAKGVVLKNAIKQEINHGWLGDFRDIFCHGQEADVEKGVVGFKGLEQRYGIERLTKVTGKKKDGTDIVEFDESPEEFVNRVVAEKSISKDKLQLMANELVAILPFDPSVREHKPAAPKKLAEKWLVHAKALLKKGAIEELNKRLSKQINKTFVATNDPAKDEVVLGWLVKEFSDSLAEATVAKLSA